MVLPIPAYQAAEVYQQEIHNALDTAEAFLISINEDPLGSIRSDRKDQKPGFCYDTLLVEHLRMAILSYGNVKDKKNCPVHWEFPVGRDWLSALMNVYWDILEELSGKVAEYTGCTPELAVDAWVTMIFRAFCWHHCHHLIASQTIIVGLNVTTKGAPPFSRGKRVGPRRTIITMRPWTIILHHVTDNPLNYR
jgi:hypothetical protein